MASIRTYMRRAIIAAFLLAVWPGQSAFAGSFQDANLFYKNEQYDRAIETYEKVLQDGFESGELYYNLGNSYFKKGDLGRAVLNYERAKIFIPHDGDLRSNHNFVRGILNVPARSGAAPWFFRWLDRSFDGFALNGLTILVSALWISILILLSLMLWLTGLRKTAVPLAGILGVVLILCSLALSRKAGFYERGAVVVAQGVEAKFEPRQEATTHFSVPEGSSVYVLDRSADWAKVRRPDAKIGWVPAASIEAIRQ
ncbi:MAG: tetratricopeptide repeat protein [Candidatus Omnitrophica bacterium]|nr:tetratricopeptide repeat protein [Candidatus Omnitrophota bacterium]